ncbi:DUF1127 domain-containing protein [Devosia nitrariae]|uniref:YjiS-like domain-containing protein n=1 Tax=Devosia nitrariae TaxID=2071872 RepID=A0ABQ5W2D7_9HYPH|nr:DUF1127 domain-containing protein [Devosia nitrariae]GLQ53969.1 hypothetical protein GCM10010862_12280 [Devosia nitrariae]
MSTFFKSIPVRWRVMRRRRRSHRNTIEVLRQFNDHLLKDIGLNEPCSTDDPWL